MSNSSVPASPGAPAAWGYCHCAGDVTLCPPPSGAVPFPNLHLTTPAACSMPFHAYSFKVLVNPTVLLVCKTYYCICCYFLSISAPINCKVPSTKSEVRKLKNQENKMHTLPCFDAAFSYLKHLCNIRTQKKNLSRKNTFLK